MASSSLAYSNWANLPKDLLDLILDKLVPLSDYVRFSSVCKPWLLVAEDQMKKRIKSCNKQLPMLMVPTDDNSEDRRSLYNVITGKTLNFQLQVPYNRRCCGSSHGWLFLLENVTLILFNPFSGTTISLPPLTIDDSVDMEESFEEYEVAKAILSTDPCLASDDYEVVAICSDMERLAYFKAGDKGWTYSRKNEFQEYNDVIFHKGHILAVNNSGRIYSAKVISSSSTTLSRQFLNLKKIATRSTTCSRMEVDTESDKHVYLVETSKGDLLMVRRLFKDEDEDEDSDESEDDDSDGDFIDYDDSGESEDDDSDGDVSDDDDSDDDDDDEKPCMTSKFEIFKLEYSYSKRIFIKSGEVKDLGGETLFLGDNHCISVSASDYPGCRPNSIYYTHDDNDILSESHRFGPCDMGVFNLEDGSFGEHYIPNPTQKHMPFPIWIVPTLKNNLCLPFFFPF